MNNKPMGIKDINAVLKKIDPNIFQDIPLTDLKGKRFAVDISIWLNTFAMSSQEFWLNLLTNFLMNLVKNDLNPIIVFDGLNVPVEKLDERENRKNSQQKSKVREDKLQHLKDKIMMTCFDGDESKIVPEEIQEEIKKSCRLSKTETLNLRDADDVLLFVMSKLNKAEQAAAGITKNHKDSARALVKAMGLSYIQADGEAESLAASMAYHGMVDGVISRDTDTMVYGCPLLITAIEKGVAKGIYLKDVLKTLEMPMKQFRDLCIALGCDYNSRIPKQGQVSCLKNIRQYGTIEGWREAQPSLPFHQLKFKRCREIFRPYSETYLKDKCKITVKPTDEKILDTLFTEANSKYTGAYVLSCLKGNAIPMFLGKETSILDDFEED